MQQVLEEEIRSKRYRQARVTIAAAQLRRNVLMYRRRDTQVLEQSSAAPSKRSAGARRPVASLKSVVDEVGLLPYNTFIALRSTAAAAAVCCD